MLIAATPQRRKPAQRLSRLAAALLALSLLPLSVASSASEAYDGYKVPPLPVAAEQTLATKTVTVRGQEIAYVEAGSGDPILFLHGVPTYSYLWRNVMPHLESQGRVVAIDLLGFGESAKQQSELTFDDHYQIVAGFIAALELDRLTLVMHDWGSALGLYYARLNPNRIQAIATMEAIVAPMMPADSYAEMPPRTAAFFRRVRAPVSGRRAIIGDNYFIESALPQAIVRPLSAAIHHQYREPFPTPDSRRYLTTWPEMMPIGGVPAHTHKLVSTYAGRPRD